jgi:hypothetical protein
MFFFFFTQKPKRNGKFENTKGKKKVLDENNDLGFPGVDTKD